MGNGSRRLVAIDRDPTQFGGGARERSDLRNGAPTIGGVVLGHRLHHDRRAAADGDVSDHDLGGCAPGAGAGNVVLRWLDGLVHGGLKYQVLVIVSNGSVETGTTGDGRFTR